MIASIYGSFYIVEPISCFPFLGVSGTYMSFLAGNISNMRLSCAVVAQEVLKVEQGSQKAELVATIAIAGSMLLNLLVVTIAALVGSSLFKVFPQSVVNAFDYIVPSIFGDLYGMFAIKYPKYGLFAIIVGIALILPGVFPVWLIIPVCVFSTGGFAVISNKRKNKIKK